MRQRFLPMMRNWMFLFVYLLLSYSSRCSNHTEIQNLFCYQWEFKNHEHSSFLQEATRMRGQIGLLASSADNIELLSCTRNRLWNTSWAMWNKLPFSFLAFLPPLFFFGGFGVCLFCFGVWFFISLFCFEKSIALLWEFLHFRKVQKENIAYILLTHPEIFMETRGLLPTKSKKNCSEITVLNSSNTVL